MRLLGIFDIAFEEDDAAGLKRLQHQAQPLRQAGAVKTYDEQLSDLPVKFESALGRHGNRRV